MKANSRLKEDFKGPKNDEELKELRYKLSQGNPIPGDFISGLQWFNGLESEMQSSFLRRVFTPSWEKAWFKIAGSKRNGEALFPKALALLQDFKDKDGFYSLGQLTEKGANPNFILSVLVKYLWLDDKIIKVREHEDPWVKVWGSFLDAIKTTKDYYLIFYKKKDSDGPHIKWLKGELGGDPKEEVELFLSEAEKNLAHLLARRDLRDPERRKHHPPADKVNRAVFAIYVHLKQRTSGPQWENFWDLLVRAGAIKGGGPKSNKDTQIYNQVDSFKKNHPREYIAIPEFIRNWPDPIAHLFRLP